MSSSAETTKPRARSIVLQSIAATVAIAGVVTAGVLLWPDSEADKAREDGENVGAAVAAVYEADSESEAEAALDGLTVAIEDTREHAGDAIAEQVADQEEDLSYAVEGYVGMIEADDEWEADAYEAELDYAVDELANQASDFRETGPEVQQAFWEGVEEGYETA